MQMSEVTAFLENAYNALNKEFFNGELTPVVITVQSSPKAHGHYTNWDAWKENDQGYREINIGAETLNRPIEDVMATLVHEMVHHYCALNGIKDTSRKGTYHNKKFLWYGENTKAIVLSYDSRIGYSPTKPSARLVAFIQAQGWQGVDLSRQGLGKAARTPKQGVRKYQCPECGCSVRATKAVNIACVDCQAIMELQEN